MNKFILTIILIVVVITGTLYYYNYQSLSVKSKIENLKLEYAIGSNSSPEDVELFASAISTLNTSERDRVYIEFEKEYYLAVAKDKYVRNYLAEKKPLFELDCAGDVSITENKSINENASSNLNEAKSLYQNVYTNLSEQSRYDWELRMSNLEYSISTSKDILFAICLD